MDKQTKILIAVGVAAIAGYYVYQKYYATPAATDVSSSGGGLTALPSTSGTGLAQFSSNPLVIGWFNSLSGHDQGIISQVINNLSTADQQGLLSFIQWQNSAAPGQRTPITAPMQAWLNSFTSEYPIYSGA